MLKGKKILLGITGGIAAYKIPLLVRLLVKAGAEVKVVLTPAAKDFVTPLTLATLSGNPVNSGFFDPETGSWNSHVELGMWADLFLIAPATANTLAKMAHGLADNYLLTVYLSARCQVMIAPAMDLDMYQHPATKKNLSELSSRGHQIIAPGVGELASGLCGEGRMEEPDKMFQLIQLFFNKQKQFIGKKVLITAGPTYEPIDPVRFIGNHSSGLMGIEIARAFAERGATVTLVLGPSNLQLQHPSVEVIPVTSADEMAAVAIPLFAQADIAVLSAAVADYKPAVAASQKIKKGGDQLFIELVQTTDIIGELGKIKQNGQILVGFALETENALQNALKKLHKKNLDLIVLNTLEDEGAGFMHQTNKISIINKKESIVHFPLKQKKEVAIDILEAISYHFNALHNKP